jgi:hypothetical protein
MRINRVKKNFFILYYNNTKADYLATVEKKINAIERKYRSPAFYMLLFSFAVSVITLIVYFAESEFSDETLFFLLAVLRYSSFLVCVCSLFLLIEGIGRIIKKPSVLSVVKTVLFLFSALYGAGIIIIDAFILSITGGNG